MCTRVCLCVCVYVGEWVKLKVCAFPASLPFSLCPSPSPVVKMALSEGQTKPDSQTLDYL